MGPGARRHRLPLLRRGGDAADPVPEPAGDSQPVRLDDPVPAHDRRARGARRPKRAACGIGAGGGLKTDCLTQSRRGETPFPLRLCVSA
jgi:hypothetical protein